MTLEMESNLSLAQFKVWQLSLDTNILTLCYPLSAEPSKSNEHMPRDSCWIYISFHFDLEGGGGGHVPVQVLLHSWELKTT